MVGFKWDMFEVKVVKFLLGWEKGFFEGFVFGVCFFELELLGLDLLKEVVSEIFDILFVSFSQGC
jgi:hypothetical protein